MKRLTALALLTLGGGLVHACALPHRGIDPSLDEPSTDAGSGGSGNSSGTSAQADGGSDTTPVGGAGGSSDTPLPAVEEGGPCSEETALACLGEAQAERLVCQTGKWTRTDACPDQQNCDRASGECLPVVAECAGANPGKRFCNDDNELIECGPDLVTTTVAEPCAEVCVTTGDTAECAPKSCGDKQRQAPEQCDDGNKVDTDDCTSACKVARCGDTATWEGHETCDDGNAVTETCTYGMKTCTVCNSTCQQAAGKAAYCGDGVFQPDNEECDAEATSTLNHCNGACTLTTWALWPLPYLTPESYAWTADYVVDKKTNLQWQRSLDGVDHTWEEAMAICPALTLANKSDWRLPTKVELESLMDYSKSDPGPMIISGSPFMGFVGDYYWSSSKMLGNDNAFAGNFGRGGIDQRAKNLPER